MRTLLPSTALVVLLFSLGPARAAADPVLLTFEGLSNEQRIGDFYNGGLGGDFGISFTRTAVGLIDRDAGGSGGFANEPSPSTVLNWFDVGRGFANVHGGFDQVSFFYSQPDGPPTQSGFIVTAYEGLNGSGAELGSWTLNKTNRFAPGDPDGGVFGEFITFDQSFAETARSLAFTEPSGAYGRAVFDNFEFNVVGAAPIPEPASILLLGGTLVGIAGRSVARRRAKSREDHTRSDVEIAKSDRAETHI
jgi:hypothetical protein